METSQIDHTAAVEKRRGWGPLTEVSPIDQLDTHIQQLEDSGKIYSIKTISVAQKRGTRGGKRAVAMVQIWTKWPA